MTGGGGDGEGVPFEVNKICLVDGDILDSEVLIFHHLRIAIHELGMFFLIVKGVRVAIGLYGSKAVGDDIMPLQIIVKFSVLPFFPNQGLV